MTAAPLETAQALYPNWGQMAQRPKLVCITNESMASSQEGIESRKAFEHYFDLRDQALSANKVGGEDLRTIQEDTRAWLAGTDLLNIPDTSEERFAYYTDFSEELARSKFEGLIGYLQENHGDKISALELETTRAFIDAAFAMYKDVPRNGSVMEDADGSYAFVVPARMGRNHPDYGEEVEPTIPAFRYLPNELRAQMMIGLPPFVIDTYQKDEQGKRGYLVLAPVFEDLAIDLSSSVSDVVKAVQHNINAAVDFTYRRFGVRKIGLGATLPAYTNYGKAIVNENVTTTTGHAGTVDLIRKTVETARGEKETHAIGVLGLGAIGEAIARIMSNEHPNAKINIYDVKKGRVDRIHKSGDMFVPCADEAEVIRSSDIVISAITNRLDLSRLGVTKLAGKVFVDDSQPGSIDPGQAEALGGAVIWVIGRDTTGIVATRRGYDYASMVDSHSDLFGCEAEVAALARYENDLRDRGMPEKAINSIIRKVAVQERVSVRKVRYISALFAKFGIQPSDPQAFGKRVNIPA